MSDKNMSDKKRTAGRVWPKNYIKRKPFSLMMPHWMYEALADAAADQDVKRSKIINDAIERALNEHFGASQIKKMRGNQ